MCEANPDTPPLPGPGDVTLYLERLTEPYSGMQLLGVGGTAPIMFEPFEVLVRYDGLPASRATPTRAAGPDGTPHWHFSTQLPLEVGKVRAQVLAVRGAAEVTLRDFALSELDERPAACAPAEAGIAAKLRGVARRGTASVVSGEVLSPARWAARLGRLASLADRAAAKVQHKLLARRFRPRTPHEGFAERTAVTPRLRAAMVAEVEQWTYRPTFSVLTPVYNVDPRWLRAAVESLLDQVYPHWELCLADDASTRPDLLQYLDRLPRDPRIKLVRRPENGHICAATNSAADIATGEFVALMDNDDRLAPEALFCLAERLQTRPDADLLFSDEDKLTEAGARYDPQHKPSWSPELLLSYNYVNHFTCVRRSVFEAAGRFRPGFEGSQDHDLLLRVTEWTDKVEHIPRILYHWRAVPESTAGAAGVKPYVHTAGRRAVQEALTRRGIDAELEVPAFARRLNLPVLGLVGPDDGPSVAIVVTGESDVRAIADRTDYRNFAVVPAPAGDDIAETLNRTTAARGEDFLLFLDAGLVPADGRWLSRLLAYARLPGVGAAGGLVRSPDGAILDGGTALGVRDGIGPGPVGRGVGPGDVSYYFYAEVGRNAPAPARGVLLTARRHFTAAGGFDAARFPRSLWAEDYCRRLAEHGLRTAHVGTAELTRTGTPESAIDPEELLRFTQSHGRDGPHGNPNFSESDALRPGGDAPLPCPAEAKAPAVRVLVAAHNLASTEGAPRYLSEIVLGLQSRAGVAPAVVSPFGGAGEVVYKRRGVEVTIVDQPWRQRFVDGRWTLPEYRSALRWLAGRICAGRPEVVVANTLLTFPVVDAAARAGVPAVWILHESYSPDVLNRLFPPLTRQRMEAAFASVARVVPASHDTAALFRHWDTRGNVRVIHNGLDAAPFEAYRRRVRPDEAAAKIGAKPGRRRFVAVGTVCERKGQHTLVEAAARLARLRRDFDCYLVGVRPEIPYARYVAELVERYDLADCVHLVPDTDDVWSYYRAADGFVCTSHMETFSRSMMEALAFGLPVVSTPCHGASEQVVWGENALQFPTGDADALADRLMRLLADDAGRAAMGRKSLALFGVHLTEAEMLDRYENVVLTAARTGPRARSPLANPSAPKARRRKAG